MLVTGASGFLGAHVVNGLAREGATVHGTRRTPGKLPDFPVAQIAWHDIDLARPNDAGSVITDVRPDVVVHLAAYGARGTQRDPQQMFDVNVLGTWSLLQALSRSTRVVMAGTSAEYGPVSGPAHEDMLCRPASLYGGTKHAAVVLATSFARQFCIPLVALRHYGPFGPGDDPHRVVPTVIAGLIKGDQVALTDGHQLRDFSYVEDHVEAIICAATAPNLQPGAVFNIGTGRAMTLRTALERVAEIVAGPGRLVFDAKAARPDDLRHLCADVSTAARDLGFETRIPFDEGVRLTADFIRTSLASARP